MNETETYYTDFLKKEDLNGKWRLYWASLDARGIYFCRDFRPQEGQEYKDNFEQLIELTPGSRCVLAKRRMYSFRFKLITAKGCHTLKCDSILQRHRWMYMIDLAVNGRPVEPPPDALNRIVISDETNITTNGTDETDSWNQRNSVKKSSSLSRTFSFKNIRGWKKRNINVPPTRCSHNKGHPSDKETEKNADINSSYSFAENLAYFED